MKTVSFQRNAVWFERLRSLGCHNLFFASPVDSSRRVAEVAERRGGGAQRGLLALPRRVDSGGLAIRNISWRPLLHPPTLAPLQCSMLPSGPPPSGPPLWGGSAAVSYGGAREGGRSRRGPRTRSAARRRRGSAWPAGAVKRACCAHSLLPLGSVALMQACLRTAHTHTHISSAC